MQVRLLPDALFLICLGTYLVRYQKPGPYCGPAAIGNAFRMLGVRIDQKRIIAACGTTENGTDTPEMLQGIRAFGFTAQSYETEDSVAAWSWVLDCLNNERPVLICTLSWRHWVTAGGLLGKRVVVVDPTNEKFNLKENGVTVQAKKDFMKRWVHRTEHAYSGISVGRK